MTSKLGDFVEVTQRTADALSRLGLGEFNTFEQPERMSFVLMVLRELDDESEWFPRGKWATIQYIEEQLTEQATEARSNARALLRAAKSEKERGS